MRRFLLALFLTAVPAVVAGQTWTARTWVDGETVDAAKMNTLRDDLLIVRGAEYTSTTSVGNVGGGEDDLHGTTLAAGAMSTDGDSFHFVSHITVAANGNTKTIKIHFGSTSSTIYTGTGSGIAFLVDVYVIRTGAATQRLMWGYVANNGSADAGVATPAETLSGTVDFKFTGESGASTSDDVLQRWTTLQFLGG